MKVPFGDLSRQYKKYKKEFDSIISAVFEKGSFILGENLKSFEKNFAKYLEAKHAIGVANGTDALFLALKAFKFFFVFFILFRSGLLTHMVPGFY